VIGCQCARVPSNATIVQCQQHNLMSFL
jgi:hypothetical protein